MARTIKSLKTPLRYPGGKSKAVSKLLPYLPDLSQVREYRELFLGGGSVALEVAKRYPHLKIWVNDLYPALVNFWQILQTNPEGLHSQLMFYKNQYPDPTAAQKKDKDFVYPAKALFDQLKHDLDSQQMPSCFHRAVAFYIVNKCSFSGLTEASSFSKQASISNWSVKGMERLPEYANIIKDWRFSSHNYAEHLINDPDVFIYLDPPYDIEDNLYGKRGSYHRDFDHDEFANRCNTCQAKLLISYNDAQLVKDRFRDPTKWTVDNYAHTYTMRSTGEYNKEQATRDELVIFNYEV